MQRHDRRRFLFSIVSFAGLAIGLKPRPTRAVPSDGPFDAQQWVSRALTQIQTVHVGMTRSQMDSVFGRAGGAYALPATAPLAGVYSYRECPYFKVQVEFQPVRKPVRNTSGDVSAPEDPGDVISKISKPYLEQVYSD